MSKVVQNYFLQEQVGKGVYGQVYRAIHQKSKLEYAVKVIPKSFFRSNPKLEQLALNEINILSVLKNENIVKFVETLKTPNNFYFVYEYCNGGTLETLLQSKKFFKETEALVIFRQLLEAFKELNKNNIMHRDLKPDNIFISEGKIKLGDFGFCKMLEVDMAQTMLGSPLYMAPQILKEQIYTLKADIWSLGVVLFEMLFGYCPFQSSSICELINTINSNELKIPRDINNISDKTEHLLRKMLVKDQFKRIDWIELFEFKINQEGFILSECRKETDIQSLERYFLNDHTPEDAEMDKRLTQTYDYGDMINEIKAKVNKENTGAKEKYSSSKPVGSPKKEENLFVGPMNFDLNIKMGQVSAKRGEEEFQRQHNKWLRCMQILLELGEYAGANEELLVHLLMVSTLREIKQASKKHPEWADVIEEEKKSLLQSLSTLNQDENVDLQLGKANVLRIWRKLEERNRKCWTKAIKMIYNCENSTSDIEMILLT